MLPPTALELRPAVLRVAPDADLLRELTILARARHVLLHVDTHEEERVGVLLDHLAAELGVARYDWTAHRGLVDTRGGEPAADSKDPATCLAWLGKVVSDVVVHLRGFGPHLEQPAVQAHLRQLHHDLMARRSVLVISDERELPRPLAGVVTRFVLPPISSAEYHRLVSAIVRDLRTRGAVDVTLSGEEVQTLLEDLKGLTHFEVQKIVTESVLDDRRLDRNDLARVRAAKMRVVQRSGVLEYTPSALTMDDVAGLGRLKSWVGRRAVAFRDPAAARKFGVEPPRGLLLLGVQGCGKSLSAKAVASELGVPLVRLDPSSLYDKYFGESEKNLRRAIRLAESMAPIVLWIDELEKAFAAVGDGGHDGGVSHRLFGTFLTWLSDKKGAVFVVATANDVSRLPPELVRKGRFDEIFFVDLPDAATRAEILALHVRRRGHDPASLDLAKLAEATAGFAGAELEQLVLSALYTALFEQRPLATDVLFQEAAQTIPLSRTMAEKVASLRAWARARAVPADESAPMSGEPSL